MRARRILILMMITAIILSACQKSFEPRKPSGNPLAIEMFLADIAQNIAGDQMTIDSFIPPGMDPHNFELNPQDRVKIEESPILIINGAGLETWISPILDDIQEEKMVITASEGLATRQSSGNHGEIDPHFWLDPQLVITYVQNIRDGFIQFDPEAKPVYEKNAEDYIQKLSELDAWIEERVAKIPVENRKLVTNHESLGYLADGYGFEIIGAIIPSTSSGSSPSAEELANLVDLIKTSGSKAIFIEVESNPQLANQIARETGIKVIQDLYTHSVPPDTGISPTYIDMMKHDVQIIVEALR